MNRMTLYLTSTHNIKGRSYHFIIPCYCIQDTCLKMYCIYTGHLLWWAWSTALNYYFCCHKRVWMVTCGILCVYTFVETKMFSVRHWSRTIHAFYFPLNAQQGSKYKLIRKPPWKPQL